MKNRILIGLLTMMVFFACSKNDDFIKSSDELMLSKDLIEQIGIDHNRALSYVESSLKETKHIKDIEEFKNHLNNKLEEFYLYESYFKKYPGLLKSNSEKIISTKLGSASYRDTAGKSTEINDVVIENSELFSEVQVLYLNKIQFILNDDESELEVVLKQFDDIKSKASDELEGIELQSILIAVEVAKQSSIYWEDNLDNWVIQLETNPTERSWFNWKSVVGADVAGAVGAAVGAFVVNALPVAGQVAYGSAVLGGAVGSSVTSGVSQVWDHFIN